MIYTSIARGLWEVIGSKGDVYRTDTENGTCTCPSWVCKTKRPCKHLLFLE